MPKFSSYKCWELNLTWKLKNWNAGVGIDMYCQIGISGGYYPL